MAFESPQATAGSPKTHTNLDHPPLEGTVRMTAELASVAKGWPEATVAAYLDRALDRLNVPYRLVYDLPPVGTADDAAGGTGFPSETQDGKQAVFGAWQTRLNQGEVRVVGKDCNLLLTNARGGGMATLGGWCAVAGANTIRADYTQSLAEWVTPDSPLSCVYGVLHETAHNLGSRHDPNWGRAWNDPDTETWNRTPTAQANSMNIAGEELPAREYDAQRKHLSYHEVARDGLAIKPVGFYDDSGAETLEDSAADLLGQAGGGED